MPRDHPWRTNRLAVGPAGSVHADLERSPLRRRALERSVRELPGGTPVVLSAGAPGAVARCRSFAAHAGVEVQREYLAFPSAQAPAYLVEDAPATVGLFIRTLLVAPPGTRLLAPLEACFAVLRALGPWRLMRMIAPGRVVVGRRA
jgi:hypothetical protein